MPILTKPRYELFAQEVAKGKTLHDAYIAAGFKENYGNASTLAQKPEVMGRINEIKSAVTEIVTEKLVLTKEYVLSCLKANYERAMQYEEIKLSDGKGTGEFTYNGAVANRAMELIGKHLGMFIDRREIGEPGEFERMNDKELVDYLRVEAKDHGFDLPAFEGDTQH